MWKHTLTCCSRTDIVVAAICPEWFKLIETRVSESFDSSVGCLRLTTSRSKENMRKFLARSPNGFGDFKDDATL